MGTQREQTENRPDFRRLLRASPIRDSSEFVHRLKVVADVVPTVFYAFN